MKRALRGDEERVAPSTKKPARQDLTGLIWLRGQDLTFSVPPRRLRLLAGPLTRPKSAGRHKRI
jgi:hypothetical protein